MALAEATVRVKLEVTRFENDLRSAVQKAAEKAGRDADRELTKGFSTAARNATREFRQVAGSESIKTGRYVSTGFQAGFVNELSKLPGRAAKIIGKDFGDALRSSIGDGVTAAGAEVSKLEGSATTHSSNAGRKSGSAFSRGFLASFVANNPLAAAGTVLAAATATDFAPSLSIIAGLPPLLFAAGTAAGVLAAAWKGVGTAFKAVAQGDLKKTQEAMDNLGPAAQRVVREFAQFAPQLSSLRRAISDAYFAQLAGQVTDLGKAFTGPLKKGLLDTSSQLGQLSRGFVSVFSSASGIENLNSVFRGTADFFGQLRPGIRNVTEAFLRFTAAASPGLNSMGEALTTLLNRMAAFLNRSANSGKALDWVEQGIEGLRGLTDTISDLGRSLLTIAQAARPIGFAFSGLIGLANSLVSAFGQLPGVLQSTILAALLLSRSGLPQFLTETAREARGQSGIFTQMAASYRTTSTAVSEYVSRQTLAAASSAAIISHSQGVATAITNTGTAFTRVASVAAGAGSAIATGLGGALRGLMGVLGGPWGIALTAAAAALAVFSSRQRDAAAASAEYKSQIREIQQTLDSVTGSVTSSSQSFAASDARIRQAADAFSKYNVLSQDVVAGALGQAQAHDRVETALRRQVNSIIDSTRASGDLDKVMAATGLTADELATALLGGAKESESLNQTLSNLSRSEDITGNALAGVIGRLQEQTGGLRDARSGWVEFTEQTKEAQIAQRKVAASIPPAAREAQRLSDAMSVLANNTASASDKARAFQVMMDRLAGKTLEIEQAQANWHETLQKVNEATQSGIDAQGGFGAAILTANGRINTQTTNGLALFRTYEDLRKSLSDTNGALLQQAQRTGDLAPAIAQMHTNVVQARDAFISQAQAMGLSRDQANQLADAVGLVPKNLTVDAAVPAYDTVKLQLEDVAKKVKDIPPGKEINVGVLSEDAKKALEEVGFKTTTLPDKTVVVSANTSTATSNLNSLLSGWNNRVLNWVVNIIGGGKALGDIVTNAGGNVLAFAGGGMLGNRMSARRAEVVPPDTWRIIGDRASGDEAFIPLNRSPRSQAILAEAARRMGYALMARGGLMSNQSSSGVTVSSGAIVINAPYSDPELVAKATVNELARAAAS